ncbi:MAG: hypothetical protein HZA20_00035 [Nitrospirae bacterium]|nr:hypothetical protein [Nitrospirota bacterium]
MMPVEKTRVLITVDTEADMRDGRVIPPELMIYGRVGGQEYGINRMMDIADRFGAVVTFFVSVYEHRRLGMEPVRKVCADIDSRGHEVQLHTHPNWIYDHRFMWGYPLAKQVELIAEGRDVIQSCIGRYPIAHRAGGFGADTNTLLALGENGIMVDSTFLNGEYSRLDPAAFPPNGVGVHNGVLEIPVSVFEQFRVGGFRPVKPFDINTNSLSEMIFLLDHAKRMRFPVVNLLMHSFSFVNRSKDRRTITPNTHDMNKFERLLEYMQNDGGFEVIGIGRYYEILRASGAKPPLEGGMPVSGVARTVARACRYPAKGKANMAIAGAFALFLLSILAAVFLIAR